MFNLWSQSNPHILEELRPKFGLQSWDVLTDQDKQNIWKYLEWYFFDANLTLNSAGTRFHGSRSEQERYKRRIYFSVATLNEKYKKNNYTPAFLETRELPEACRDFYTIFMSQNENVVLELLSLYCKFLLAERAEKKLPIEVDESEEAYTDRNTKWRYE